MGYVYLLNPSSTYVGYTVNQQGAPAGEPAAPDDHTPSLVWVPRAQHADVAPPCFGYGDNTFTASFRDARPGERGVCAYTIHIPTTSSIDDDLILYVFRTDLLMMSDRGYALPESSGFWWRPLS